MEPSRLKIPETSPTRYLSGIVALNIPSEADTGDWHQTQIFFVPHSMHYADLRKVTGGNHLHDEGEGNAPFGRAALVRTWQTSSGTALALDTSHPLYPSLRRLLIRLDGHGVLTRSCEGRDPLTTNQA